ncbi:MAG TPA: hypothetical protein VF457_08890 [Burkholderiaceae bacterium]
MPAPERFVAIATPSLDGNVSAHYTASLVRTMALMHERGVRVGLHLEIGNSLVTDARNQLVSRFLATPATELVFIDADLSWQEQDFARLLAHDAPLVAGVYQRKSREKVDFTVKFGPTITREPGGLVEALRAGTGFMRLRRDCLERMIAAHPALKLRNAKQPGDPHLYALFDTSIADGEYVGEDYTFCDRWRAIGGRVMVDPSLAFAHHGAAAYDEPLAKYLQLRTG